MAIIYTYPKLNNPQGNELVVVSDVNNKNSTRLITLQSIASLIPSGGDGCSNAISGIQTPVGTYNANLCTTTSFTSSGGSVSISNTTEGVNFETNCINNYVLKPVICQGAQCNASTASETWLFSCDSSLSQYAGINTPVILENNGSIVPHSQNLDPNSPTNCFYVELWSPTVSLASTCQSCCNGTPAELKCLYTKCSGGDPNMPDNLTFDKVNDACTTGVIYATQTASNYSSCYTYLSEVDAPASTGYTFISATDCNQAPCISTPQEKTWFRCENSCDFGTLPETVYGNQINGDGLVVLGNGVNEACYTLNGTSDNVQTPGIIQISVNNGLDCNTSVEQGVCKASLYHFVKCADASCTGDAASVTNVYATSNFGLSTEEVILFEFDDRSSCCYVLQSEQVCQKVTQGINFSTATKVEGLDPCASEACGETPPPAEKWVYNSCSGCDPIVSTTPLHTPGIHNSLWWNCCYYSVPASVEATSAPDSGITIEQVIKSDLNCESLLTNNQIEWSKCGDTNTKIYTDCCNINEDLHLGFVAKGFSGPDGCYEITSLNKEQDTSPCDNITETTCADEDCTVQEFKWQTRLCDTEIFTDVSTDYTGDADNLNEIYTFEGADNCFQIQKVIGTATGAAGPTIISGPYSSTVDETACECCNNKNHHRYSKCQVSEPLSGCANLDPVIVLDIANPPNVILVEQTETGDTCCYELEGSTCENATVGYTSIDTPKDCKDAKCVEPVNNYLLKQCLDSTLSGCEEMPSNVIVSIGAPLGSTVILRDDNTNRECCYVVDSTTTSAPTGGYTILQSVSDCASEQCLEAPVDIVKQYTKCQQTIEEGSASCNLMAQNVNINIGQGPAQTNVIIRDSATGNQCCYVLVGDAVEPTENHAIVSPINGCDVESLTIANCLAERSGEPPVSG